jgi:S1-C subfamily serine protease
VITQLLTHGRIRRGYLGIVGQTRPLGRRLVLFHKLAKEQAVAVMSVDDNGPAKRAGIRKGDIIIGVDDHEVTNMDDLFHYLSEWQPGERVTITVIRRKEKISFDLMPVEKTSVT